MTAARYLLDSDILIEHLRGRQQARDFLFALQQEGELFVSAITVAELFTGVRNNRDEQAVNDLLRLTRTISIDATIAKRGGVIRRQYRQSHGTGLPDALIAATAESAGATLITFNQRHFPMISSLRIPYER
jgi:predicted nucleic acid-binding protein